jgi:aryl-alcohol dehydrogenase-like predicted oxidoreductase
MLGKTGVSLPILGFGTAHSGLRLSTRDAINLYETAFRQGITYFDTAPEFAGYGKAQIQLSHFLKHVRQQDFLVTKCYEPEGERALQLLHKSLKEMGTTYADLVFVHSVGADKMDPKVVFGKHGTYAALMKARTLGLTRFVGLSGHSRPLRFFQAVRQFEIDVLLNAVNFVDRHTYNFEEQVWPAAAAANIGMIAMKVYGGAQEPPPDTLSHSKMPVEFHEVAFRYTP